LPTSSWTTSKLLHGLGCLLIISAHIRRVSYNYIYHENDEQSQRSSSSSEINSCKRSNIKSRSSELADWTRTSTYSWRTQTMLMAIGTSWGKASFTNIEVKSWWNSDVSKRTSKNHYQPRINHYHNSCLSKWPSKHHCQNLGISQYTSRHHWYPRLNHHQLWNLKMLKILFSRKK
jgi:hypothetical protein